MFTLAPVPNFFPQLWQAYGATARVILTYRTPTAWYASRSENRVPKSCFASDQFLENRSAVFKLHATWGLQPTNCTRWIDELQVQGGGSHTLMPGSWGASRDEPLSAARWCNTSVRKTEARVDADTVQRAYSAHNALVRSLVPSSRLLDIDITTLTAAETWARVAKFLHRPIPADACLDADCRFPELRSREPYPFPTVNLTDNRSDQRCRLSAELDEAVHESHRKRSLSLPVASTAVGLAELPSLGETAADVEVVTRDVDEDEDEFVDEPNWEGGELDGPVSVT